MSKSFSKVLVTGAAGFVGSTIIDQLVNSNIVGDIVGVDNMIRGRRENLAESLKDRRVQFFEGDIRDTALMARLIDGCDLVFHQAALRITHCAEEPRLAFDVMAQATFDLLELAATRKLGKMVAASSASIYGLADRFPTPEESPPYDNRTLYGACKIFNEALLRSYNEMYGLDYVALRYFNAYGPRMDIHGKYTEVLIRWMDRIANKQSPIIFGDGKQTMDFIYVDDIARANILAAQADVSDDVFNVASGTETSLYELARTLLEVMEADLPIEYAEERKVNPVPRRLADTEKAKRMLGFESTVSLDDGLRRLVEWWRRERGSLMTPDVAGGGARAG